MPAESTTRHITSPQNARIKALRRALSSGELADGLCGLDSEHLVLEAARSDLAIDTLLISHSRAQRDSSAYNISAREMLIVADDVFRSVVTTEHPQGVAALARAPQWQPDPILSAQRALVIVLAGIQDPGNCGTIIRSAEAFGAAAVIPLRGTVSEWNPKTMRASSGSIFRLPVLHLADDPVAELRRHGFTLVGAAARSSVSADQTDLTRKIALVIGNEGAGLTRALLSQLDSTLRIPHSSAVESLNAGIAASILLYEAHRQRTIANGGISPKATKEVRA